MLNTSVMRPAGRTYRLNLTTSASAALQINEVGTNDQISMVSLLNIGTGVAAVELAPLAANLVSPTIASDGNSGSYILPPAMNMPCWFAGPGPRLPHSSKKSSGRP